MKQLLLILCFLTFAACKQESAPPETVTLQITGMTCQNCVDGITSAVSKLPGVTNCVVDLEGESAVVTYVPNHLSAGQIQQRINQLGFSASLPDAE